MKRTLIRIEDSHGNKAELDESLTITVTGDREALLHRLTVWMDELASGTFDGQYTEAESGRAWCVFSVTGFDLTLQERDYDGELAALNDEIADELRGDA